MSKINRVEESVDGKENKFLYAGCEDNRHTNLLIEHAELVKELEHARLVQERLQKELEEARKKKNSYYAAWQKALQRLDFIYAIIIEAQADIDDALDFERF
ncbi:unnamed protein product [Cylicocyclus nassatus]|uniref:Uncharacterized protein n=1 Tax=Cylicocyclus nassatus TaxID=53992 RepID=A0AA36H8K9_CYLNA|nr:unnamed protein product [Cylicocyclus nassatus]